MKLKTATIVISIFSMSFLSGNNILISQENMGNLTKKNIAIDDKEFHYFTKIPSSSMNWDNLYTFFHGEYSGSEKFIKMTNILKDIGEKDILLVPNSLYDSWYSKNSYLKNKNFFEEIYNSYKKNFRFKKNYAIAYSEGASILTDYICESDIKYDGILLINAGMKSETFNSCKNKKLKNTKVVFAYGTEDDFYTFNDKTKINNDFKKPVDSLTIKETLSFYENLVGCSDPAKFSYPDKYKDDNSKIYISSYTCDYKLKNNLKVLNIDNMGHNWPQNNKYGFSDFRGNINNDIEIVNYSKIFFIK